MVATRIYRYPGQKSLKNHNFEPLCPHIYDRDVRPVEQSGQLYHWLDLVHIRGNCFQKMFHWVIYIYDLNLRFLYFGDFRVQFLYHVKTSM